MSGQAGRVCRPSILVVLGGVRVPEGAQDLAGTAGPGELSPNLSGRRIPCASRS